MRWWMWVGLVGCKVGGGVRALDEAETSSHPPDLAVDAQVDRVVQRAQPLVDVLFVVDNSCSMDAEQQALAANFPAFAEWFELSGLDFHIGVTSTDTSSLEAGKLRAVGDIRFIDSETPDPAGVFVDMAVMGTGGDTEERGRDAAFRTLELNRDIPRNEGFYREDASLHLVFVSDEDDSSTAAPISRVEFREWMDTLKPIPDGVTAHAITWVPGEPCSAAYETGGTYVAYADWTGGALLNICEPDWEPFMTDLGLQTSGLKQEFFLSRLPTVDPMTIEVETLTLNDAGQEVVRAFEVCVAGEGCPVEYIASRNSVVFIDFVPEPLSTVRITYSVREVFDESHTDLQ